MTESEKKEILETYKWIKVKKFVDDPSKTWEERYKFLEEHHSMETNFLINKVREIVNTKNEAYLLIQCGYEGIEGLLHLSESKEEVISKINELRAEIKRVNYKIAELTKEFDVENIRELEIEDLVKAGKITWEESHLSYTEADSYCIMKWDGKEFKCVCSELGVSPEQSWLY